MKLEETENLKLQYVNRIETNTTHINNVQESDTELIEKITEILNIYERNPIFKGKPSSRNSVIIADDTHTVLPNVDKNNNYSDIISLHVYNNTPYKITLPLGLLGYCETNATISPINEVAYRVNNILQLLDICQPTVLDEELFINNKISSEKRNTDYFTKTPYFKPTFNITNYTKEQQKFLTMFNFQH